MFVSPSLPSLLLVVLFVAACSLTSNRALAEDTTPAMSAQQQHDDLHPAVEVEAVWGCADDSRPRKTSSGCVAGTPITIRGRNFGRYGARVFLSQADEKLPGRESASDASRLVCTSPKHSAWLPSILLLCTLPPAKEGATFHVRVAIRNGITGVLRSALTYSSIDSAAMGEEDASNTKQSAKSDAALRSLQAGNWEALGVGGLGPQFRDVFRRAFASRLGALSSIVAEAGVRHVKGMIFHGLPGTGKTLVARKVAEALGSKFVRVVNGPEIMSKFVGDSEKNLRELFRDAEDSYAADGTRAPLHVIIIDEMDAILRSRGSGKDDSSAKAVYDGVTTQMLSYMDGVKGIGNLLIIGLTNRLDVLDPALLRPGRFEVQIRFPLPDREGRRQILHIHGKQLAEKKLLAPSIDMEGVLDATASFSGADLAAVVRSATSYAMARVLEAEDGADQEDATASFRVTSKDYFRGIQEVLQSKPSYASTHAFIPHGIVPYHQRVTSLLERMARHAQDVKEGAAGRTLRVLLEGPPETGLTATAAAVAQRARFPHVHVLSGDTLIGLSTDDKLERIRQAFDAASQAPSACIILDGLEHLVEYNAVQQRLNSALQLEVAALLRRSVSNKDSRGSSDEPSGRVLLLATSSSAEAVRTITGGAPVFDAVELLLPLSRVDVARVIEAYGVEGGAKVAQKLPATVPIKRLLLWLGVAKSRASRQGQAALRPNDGLNLLAVDDGLSDADPSRDPQQQKAEDPVPHEVLVEVLEAYGVVDGEFDDRHIPEVVLW